MAIKGKRKPRSRSGAPRRRPAAARPVPVSTAATPWYRTMRGQLALIVAGLALVGIGMWFVSARSSATAEQSARQDELTAYTREVADLVSQAQQPVREMHGAAFNTANPEAIAALDGSAPEWGDALERLAALSQNLQPPQGLERSATVIQQALLGYRTAARTYELVPGEAENKRQQALIDRATEQRDQAGAVLIASLGMLDDERAEVDMDPSGIQAPSTMTPIIPSPAPVTGGGGSASKNEKQRDG
ncbi:MAG TPA: hypothetical protein VG929_07720 [Actinomycetota bacterium]|nr:hypothetical protein [Actinomycetota bacterium]